MTTGKRACIFGASGGVGRALVEALAASGEYARIYACSRAGSPFSMPSVVALTFDLTNQASIAAVAAEIALEGALDLVIVATGILHRPGTIGPEKSASALDPEVMAEVFALNTIGPALIGKHLLPLLSRHGAVFAVLSARVGSIEDNRLGGWHSYRASKAALNMLVRNFAIETARRNPLAVIVALHPGTVATSLSEPFQRNVTHGALQSPNQSAGHLLTVIGGLTPGESGGFYAWDGEAIPF
ncbi:MAG: SDR family NAD(P)-dependent oxidoreductase [Pseudomonadota bacterium]